MDVQGPNPLFHLSPANYKQLSNQYEKMDEKTETPLPQEKSDFYEKVSELVQPILNRAIEAPKKGDIPPQAQTDIRIGEEERDEAGYTMETLQSLKEKVHTLQQKGILKRMVGIFKSVFFEEANQRVGEWDKTENQFKKTETLVDKAIQKLKGTAAYDEYQYHTGMDKKKF